MHRCAQNKGIIYSNEDGMKYRSRDVSFWRIAMGLCYQYSASKKFLRVSSMEMMFTQNLDTQCHGRSEKTCRLFKLTMSIQRKREVV